MSHTQHVDERTEIDLFGVVLSIADCVSYEALRQACCGALRMWLGTEAIGFHLFAEAGVNQVSFVAAESDMPLDHIPALRLLGDTFALKRMFRTKSSFDEIALMGRHCWSEIHYGEHLGQPVLYEIVAGPIVATQQLVGAIVFGGKILSPAPERSSVFPMRDLYRYEAIGSAAAMAVARIKSTANLQRSLEKTWRSLQESDEQEAGDSEALKTMVASAMQPSSVLDRATLLSLPLRAASIAELLCEGKTNKGIATALKISPNTVRDYVQNLCRRFGVANRTELVRRLIEGA